MILLNVKLEFYDGAVLKYSYDEDLPKKKAERRIESLRFQLNAQSYYGSLSLTFRHLARVMDIRNGYIIKVYFDDVMYYEGYITTPNVTREETWAPDTNSMRIRALGIFNQLDGLLYTLAFENVDDGGFDTVTTNTVDLLRDIAHNDQHAGKYKINNRPFSSDASPTGYTDMLFSTATAAIDSVPMSVKYLRTSVLNVIRQIKDYLNGAESGEPWNYYINQNRQLVFKQRTPSANPLKEYTFIDPLLEVDNSVEIIKITDTYVTSGLINEFIVDDTVLTLSGQEEVARQDSIEKNGLHSYSLPNDSLNVSIADVQEWYNGVASLLYGVLLQQKIEFNPLRDSLKPPRFSNLNGYAKVWDQDGGIYLLQPFLSVEYTLFNDGIKTVIVTGEQRPSIKQREQYLDLDNAPVEPPAPDDQPPTVQIIEEPPVAYELKAKKRKNPMYLACHAKDNVSVSSVAVYYEKWNTVSETWESPQLIGSCSLQAAPDEHSEPFWRYDDSDPNPGYKDFTGTFVDGDIFKIKFKALDPSSNIGIDEQIYEFENLAPKPIIQITPAVNTADKFQEWGTGAAVIDIVEIGNHDGTAQYNFKIKIDEPELVETITAKKRDTDIPLTKVTGALREDGTSDIYWSASSNQLQPEDGSGLLIPGSHPARFLGITDIIEVTVTNRWGKITKTKAYVKGKIEKGINPIISIEDNSATTDKTSIEPTGVTTDFTLSINLYEDKSRVLFDATEQATNVIFTFERTEAPYSKESFTGATAYPIVEGTGKTGDPPVGYDYQTFYLDSDGTKLGLAYAVYKVWVTYTRTYWARDFDDSTRGSTEVTKTTDPIYISIVNKTVQEQSDDTDAAVAVLETVDVPLAQRKIIDGDDELEFFDQDPQYPTLDRGAGLYYTLDGGTSWTLSTIAAITGIDHHSFTTNQNDTDVPYVYHIFRGGVTNGYRAALRFDTTARTVDVNNQFDEGNPTAGTWIPLSTGAADKIIKTVSAKIYEVSIEEGTGDMVFTTDTGGTPVEAFRVSGQIGSVGVVTFANDLIPDDHDAWALGDNTNRMNLVYTTTLKVQDIDLEVESPAETYTRKARIYYHVGSDSYIAENIGLGFWED